MEFVINHYLVAWSCRVCVAPNLKTVVSWSSVLLCRMLSCRVVSPMCELGLSLMYKVFNGGAPSYLNTFEYTDSTYSLRSISTENLLVPRPKMESFRNSFSYSGAYAWNQLPSNIKNAPDVFVFKKMLKQHILLIDN